MENIENIEKQCRLLKKKKKRSAADDKNAHVNSLKTLFRITFEK